jgi:hypothetical protein
MLQAGNRPAVGVGVGVGVDVEWESVCERSGCGAHLLREIVWVFSKRCL